MGKTTAQKLMGKSADSRVSTKKKSLRNRKKRASLDNPWPTQTLYMSKQLTLFDALPSTRTFITTNGYGRNSRTLQAKPISTIHSKN